ncbi:glycosyl transferase family 90 [Halomonas almeriensis]|uniref:glycosyl transferase family 90 n=1 Tax=Halomonas almeriensis TaxID=308163 RepID=UPI0025B36E04|nr:glycosyl transferase family 90 [Halomonas almeriensis]MDN3552484.1 glycosyl transferase family 90 [Halomonas almeriensis]
MSAIRSRPHKNLHKVSIYSGHAARRLIPAVWLRHQRERLLGQLHTLPLAEQIDIGHRVHYCNRLSAPVTLPATASSLADFPREKSRSYQLDLQDMLRYFPSHLRFCHLFGDVTDIPEVPTLVKSRPIADDNHNSVLLKLNRVRHYYLPRDRLSHEQKKPLAVWRGSCHQDHRRRFVETFHDHPRCNIADIHPNAAGKPWHGDFMSVDEQLQYRYIISLEGKDVATNLKWIMASNSLCLMRRPRYETWFMEGRLEPGVHYVPLKDDYSDLDDQLAYYDAHPEEARAIIRRANRYVDTFRDQARERLIGLLVLHKYFADSGQLPPLDLPSGD